MKTTLAFWLQIFKRILYGSKLNLDLSGLFAIESQHTNCRKAIYYEILQTGSSCRWSFYPHVVIWIIAFQIILLQNRIWTMNGNRRCRQRHLFILIEKKTNSAHTQSRSFSSLSLQGYSFEYLYHGDYRGNRETLI